MRHGPLLRTICLLLSSQLGCLALGIWLHYQFVCSSSEWTSQQQLAQRLAATAHQMAEQLQAADGEAPLPRMPLPAPYGALLLDREGTILAHQSPAKTGPEQPSELKAVLWKPIPGAEPLGMLHLASGARLAVIQPLARRGARLVVYSDETRLPTSGSAVLDSLPLAGAIAWCWIGGLQAVAGYLVFSRYHAAQQSTQAKHDADALRRTQDLVRTRDAVIFGLAKLAESRDTDTGLHLERISLYATRLAAALQREPAYRDMISPGFIRLIGISSALHDIGKVGIRDETLLKPGKLTLAERAHIETHTLIGGDCLRTLERRLGESNFLEMAREIALYHHERWDGTGYPARLAGTGIPLAARIVAIVDVYDALSQRRVYREPLPHQECVEYIRAHAGSHFDPSIVEVFLKIEPQFRDIARRYAAEAESLTRRSDENQPEQLLDAVTPAPAPRPATFPAETSPLVSLANPT